MSDKLKLDFSYCYGIKKLNETLEFKAKGFAIYAPNGVMKTSFAKSMLDLSTGKTPSDLAFPHRESACEALLNGKALKPEEIFVVKSYDENYSASEISTLLANAELKKKYEKIHKDISDAKKELDKRLRELSGYGGKSRENLNPIVERIFGKSYYESILDIEDSVSQSSAESFGTADYKIIFDSKVQQLLNNDKVGADVDDFAKKYDELTESSPYLKSDFQYHNVSQVQSQLDANNFFKAGHSINLVNKNNNSRDEINTNQSLKETIDNEKKRVLNNPDLREKFEAFNAKLKNKELQIFRDYITQNLHLLPELQNPSEFERKLWLQYFYQARPEYNNLVSSYKSGQSELKAIISEASKELNDWDEVIDSFNERFLHLPFKLAVENKADVVLEGKAPSIEFIFKDGEEEAVYKENQRKELLKVLSTGEARALYILNIMFEVHVKWKLRKDTLFIFDDIADSFDYKNKFAIVDYLYDLVKPEDSNFLAIILTHNFDFLRTLESRNICPAHQCRLAFKNYNGVTLHEFKQSEIRNPLDRWHGRLDEPEILIAYIPFLRNVIEYTKGIKNAEGVEDPGYQTLTRMLHYKDETEDLKVADYKQVFDQTFPHLVFPNIPLDTPMIELVSQTAEQSLTVNDGINLEQKIVLSISIRLLAEKFMVTKIRSNDTEYDVSKKQMGNLFQDFKERFNNQNDEITLLKKVNLITPSNIHINAFMYEPILDMGYSELTKLYIDVKSGLTTVVH